jgi:hypothetical protein
MSAINVADYEGGTREEKEQNMLREMRDKMPQTKFVKFDEQLNQDMAKAEETEELRPEDWDKFRDRGKKAFTSRSFSTAKDEYTLAIKCHRKKPGVVPDRDLAALYANRAMCFMKTQCPNEVVNDCDKALDLANGWEKPLSTKAGALVHMEQWHEAVETLHELLQVQQKGKDDKSKDRAAKTAEKLKEAEQKAALCPAPVRVARTVDAQEKKKTDQKQQAEDMASSPSKAAKQKVAATTATPSRAARGRPSVATKAAAKARVAALDWNAELSLPPLPPANSQAVQSAIAKGAVKLSERQAIQLQRALYSSCDVPGGFDKHSNEADQASGGSTLTCIEALDVLANLYHDALKVRNREEAAKRMGEVQKVMRELGVLPPLVALLLNKDSAVRLKSIMVVARAVEASPMNTEVLVRHQLLPALVLICKRPGKDDEDGDGLKVHGHSAVEQPIPVMAMAAAAIGAIVANTPAHIETIINYGAVRQLYSLLALSTALEADPEEDEMLGGFAGWFRKQTDEGMLSGGSGLSAGGEDQLLMLQLQCSSAVLGIIKGSEGRARQREVVVGISQTSGAPAPLVLLQHWRNKMRLEGEPNTGGVGPTPAGGAGDKERARMMGERIVSNCLQLALAAMEVEPDSTHAWVANGVLPTVAMLLSGLEPRDVPTPALSAPKQPDEKSSSSSSSSSSGGGSSGGSGGTNANASTSMVWGLLSWIVSVAFWWTKLLTFGMLFPPAADKMVKTATEATDKGSEGGGAIVASSDDDLWADVSARAPVNASENATRRIALRVLNLLLQDEACTASHLLVNAASVSQSKELDDDDDDDDDDDEELSMRSENGDFDRAIAMLSNNMHGLFDASTGWDPSSISRSRRSTRVVTKAFRLQFRVLPALVAVFRLRPGDATKENKGAAALLQDLQRDAVGVLITLAARVGQQSLAAGKQQGNANSGTDLAPFDEGGAAAVTRAILKAEVLPELALLLGHPSIAVIGLGSKSVEGPKEAPKEEELELALSVVRMVGMLGVNRGVVGRGSVQEAVAECGLLKLPLALLEMGMAGRPGSKQKGGKQMQPDQAQKCISTAIFALAHLTHECRKSAEQLQQGLDELLDARALNASWGPSSLEQFLGPLVADRIVDAYTADVIVRNCKE